MKYTVRFSPFAKEDKEEIKAYLGKFYPGTPRRFVDLLKEHITNLKDNPYMYPEYPENTNYRRMQKPPNGGLLIISYMQKARRDLCLSVITSSFIKSIIPKGR